MEKLNDNKKGGLHPIIIGVILFFIVAFLFTGWKIIGERNKNGNWNVDKMVGEGASDMDGGNETTRNYKITVVIDPGHGGNDPGKVSPDGILEKEINLQIALLLMEELQDRDIEAIMTRTTDNNLATDGATNKKVSDMKNRVGIINEANPQLLVSIHQNSYSDSSVRGPQVFYYGESEKGEEFALALQEKLKAINPDYAREAKEGNDYYILNKSICPGVIVECGFLSCPAEAAMLTSEKYQQKIASAIADAIEEAY